MPNSNVRRLEAKLSLRIKKVLKILKIDAEAAFFLLRNEDLRILKAKYARKKPKKIVDILAFPETKGFPHPEAKSGHLGEIYLNVNIAEEDFERAKTLAVHGLLHLLGYTHEGKSDILKMEKMEKRMSAVLDRRK